jgi:hypothetical protein
MLTGLFLAALASGLFNAAVVLQAIEAREVPSEHGLRLSLLGRLARQPRWLGGIGLSVAAVSLQILALTLAPLSGAARRRRRTSAAVNCGQPSTRRAGREA